jgi:uncharacterized damage-inducible protein DinB
MSDDQLQGLDIPPYDGHIGDERAMLAGFLDANRREVIRRVEGLDRAAASAVVTSTGLTVLNVVQHLTWCEHSWFEHHLLGETWCGIDDDASFALEPDDTVESVLDGYRAICDRSRATVAALPLDTLSVEPHFYFGIVDLRWVMIHMIEETARHAGHQDILREQTDGSTGW